MKHIDVITLTESVTDVIRLANENGAIDCYAGNTDDQNNQYIHIKASDDKHQTLYKALQTYFSSSSTSSVEIRAVEHDTSDHHEYEKNLDPKDQLATNNNSDISNQVDLSLFMIVFLAVCVLLFVLFQVLDTAF